MTRLVLHLFLLLSCSSFIGCASPPPPSGPPFQGVERAPTGQARLYVFRPEFSKALVKEQPTLILNGQPKASLAVERYATFVLPPGRHVISLAPRRFESSVWRADAPLNLEADSIYFVGIWNTTETERGIQLVPLVGGVGAFPLSSASLRATGVRIEPVREEEALPVLNGMFQADPADSAP